ncbi:hypothetical protein QWY86_09550 [Pedobacter aquatilis]|uniref:hypothetical protein n=1 Tax=Pedobacter aquatilis TaxID=351343 RepID=UPI0025B4ACED|nr:hypothetical protein [Pedobacter aquatilis]MDN3586912.1 hypothetical protein [Pedobacter aquatilis]
MKKDTITFAKFGFASIDQTFMKDNLSNQSLESLIKQRNLLKGVAIGFGVVLLLAFTIILYVAFQKKNFGLIAVLPASMITLLPILIRFGQINTEIKSRQVN